LKQQLKSHKLCETYAFHEWNSYAGFVWEFLKCGVVYKFSSISILCLFHLITVLSIFCSFWRFQAKDNLLLYTDVYFYLSEFLLLYTVKFFYVKSLLSYLATVFSVVLTVNSQRKLQTKPIKIQIFLLFYWFCLWFYWFILWIHC
jgi:hypothetical protein